MAQVIEQKVVTVLNDDTEINIVITDLAITGWFCSLITPNPDGLNVILLFTRSVVSV